MKLRKTLFIVTDDYERPVKLIKKTRSPIAALLAAMSHPDGSYNIQVEKPNAKYPIYVMEANSFDLAIALYCIFQVENWIEVPYYGEIDRDWFMSKTGFRPSPLGFNLDHEESENISQIILALTGKRYKGHIS